MFVTLNILQKSDIRIAKMLHQMRCSKGIEKKNDKKQDKLKAKLCRVTVKNLVKQVPNSVPNIRFIPHSLYSITQIRSFNSQERLLSVTVHKPHRHRSQAIARILLTIIRDHLRLSSRIT